MRAVGLRPLLEQSCLSHSIELLLEHVQVEGNAVSDPAVAVGDEFGQLLSGGGREGLGLLQALGGEPVDLEET